MTKAREIAELGQKLTVDASGNLGFAGDLELGDNNKAIFGAGSDLQIYHDGDHSYIADEGTGELRLEASSLIRMMGNNGETLAVFNEDGAVSLRYDGSAKLATTSTGVDITGTLTSDGLTVDGLAKIQGVSTGLLINETDTTDVNSYLTTSGGVFKIFTTNDAFSSFTERLRVNHSTGDISFYEDTGTTAKFFWDASEERLKLTTSSAGALVLDRGASGNQIRFDNAGTVLGYIGYLDGTGFGIAGNNGTADLVVDESGNVGIATTLPTNRLTAMAGSSNTAVATFGGTNTSRGLVISTNTGGGLNEAGVDFNAQTATYGQLRFSIAGSEAMRIDSSGNLIVGGTVEGYTGYADTLTVSNTTGLAGMTIRSANTSTGSIFFSDVNANTGSGAYAGYLQYLHSVDAMLLGTGSTERMRIDSSGQVGIGTSSPSSYHANADNLVIQDSGNAGITIATTDSAYYSQINFADGTSGAQAYTGILRYAHSDNSLRIIVNTGEKMRISSGGVVSIGNTAPKTWHSNSTGVIQFGGVGALENYNTTDDVVIFSANQYRASDGVFKYMETNEATRIVQYQGNIFFATAPSGTADTAATFTNRLYITNTGNVGIGTDSPVVPLNIEAAGSSSAGENTHLRINDTTNMAAGVGGVIQLSGEADSGGTTQYSFATIKGIKENGTSGNYDGALTFSTRTNGVSPAAERMRIDSSGNLIVSKTTTGWNDEGIVLFSTAAASGSRIDVTTDGGSPINLNRLTSDGEIAGFYKDGTQVGSIGTAGGDLYIGNTDTGLYFNDNTNVIHSYNVSTQSGGSTDGTVDLGQSSVRWKDLYLSGSLSDGTTSRTVADIVGLTSSQFLRSDADDTASGDITFTGFVTFDNDASPAVKIISDDFAEGLEIHRNHASNAPAIKFSNTSAQLGILYANSSEDLIWRDGASTNNNTIWTSGNDGSGSGLDADTVDGIEASSFLRSDQSDTMTGDLTVSENLKADGGNLIIGDDAYSTSSSYVGMKTSFMSGTSDYMIISGTSDGNTYVSAKSGSDVHIRGGANNSVYAITVYPDQWPTVGNSAHTIWHAGNATGAGYVDVATGNYGTIKVDDDRSTGWAGYAIQDDWVFMGRADDCGIYNDTDNEWAIYIVRNAETRLYYNGLEKLRTASGGITVTGALTATSDITAYFSDERLKDFDGKIEGALDKVSQLSGYYFRENDKAKELGFENDARQVGVSAQEVEAVLPEVIKPAPVDPEYKTVQYEKLVPLLIEAIKELKEEVRQLKEDKA